MSERVGEWVRTASGAAAALVIPVMVPVMVPCRCADPSNSTIEANSGRVNCTGTTPVQVPVVTHSVRTDRHQRPQYTGRDNKKHNNDCEVNCRYLFFVLDVKD